MILTSMPVMGTYLLFIPSAWKHVANQFNFLFWMEWTAVWSFAAAWLTKGRAIFTDIMVDMLAIPSRLLNEQTL